MDPPSHCPLVLDLVAPDQDPAKRYVEMADMFSSFCVVLSEQEFAEQWTSKSAETLESIGGMVPVEVTHFDTPVGAHITTVLDLLKQPVNTIRFHVTRARTPAIRSAFGELMASSQAAQYISRIEMQQWLKPDKNRVQFA